MDKIVRRIAAVLLVVQCVVIFAFSAQPAESSSKTSKSVTKKIVRMVPAMKHKDEKTVDKKAKELEHTVRKIAHFSLYLLLGVFAYVTSDGYLKKNTLWFALLFCLLYAASDEIHQLFSPGRSCEFRDVCIDFSGSLCGALLALNIKKRLIKRRKKA